MLCRVAENLFWLGRYLERAIATVRLIDVTAHLELDAGEAEEREVNFWTPLLGAGLLQDTQQSVPLVPDVRHHLAFSRSNPNSLVSCIHAARAAARGIRDSISSEMWEALNREYLGVADDQLPTTVAQDAHGFFKRVQEGLLLARTEVDTFLDDPFRLPAQRPAPLDPRTATDSLQPSELVPLDSDIAALAEP